MRPDRDNASAAANRAASRVRQAASEGDWRSSLARAGLTAKGVLYAALGLLAIQVALGAASSQSVSKRGAIELVASQPFGQWLLGLLTVGLFALAIWQTLLAFTGDPVEGGEAKDRAKYAGKAAIYLGTAITALSILVAHWGASGTTSGAVGTSGGAGSGGASGEQATAVVMGWPGGPWLVGLAGLAVIGAAGYQLYKHAWKQAFMRRLDRFEMTRTVDQWVERAGRSGYAARAVVIAIVGIFFIVAAVQHDPQEAVGLSGALHTLASREWGQVLLWGVAIGLFLFGIFCFAEAKYRRAT